MPYDPIHRLDIPELVARALKLPGRAGESLLRDALADWEADARAGALFEPGTDSRDRVSWYSSAVDVGWEAWEEAVYAGKMTGPRLLLHLRNRTDVPPSMMAAALSERILSGPLKSSRPLALAALDDVGLAVRQGERSWLTEVLEHGRLTPLEVLTRGRPVASAVRALRSVHLDTRVREQVDAAIDELIARRLTGNVHAWLAVAAFSPDFVGSLTELLETAAAAVG